MFVLILNVSLSKLVYSFESLSCHMCRQADRTTIDIFLLNFQTFYDDNCVMISWVCMLITYLSIMEKTDRHTVILRLNKFLVVLHLSILIIIVVI